ncbi:hypothetical protein SAV31267_092000 [Streptomyces avermitilis]|uniref:F5/8 type C domain-containing protein n=1 Tax=Streptomyces avermitilis TaxID=33903 RepID=A0A4D4N8A2_STRAX|nr:hypothetical protein SAV31267_092000 [Streptomyces avermitilis]
MTLKDLRDGTHRTLAARYVLDATETGELLHLAGVEHANGAESRATACPLADLALGRIVFPTAPLPPGMTDPRAAVDGDAGTAWSPGPDGRMVVDLDAEQHITEIRTQWRGGHARHPKSSSAGTAVRTVALRSCRRVASCAPTAPPATWHYGSSLRPRDPPHSSPSLLRRSGRIGDSRLGMNRRTGCDARGATWRAAARLEDNCCSDVACQ